MRSLLLLLLVLGGVWLWRSRISHRTPATSARANKAAGTTTMLRCDVCGVHVPGPDAVRTRNGVYCSAEHRLQVEP